MNIVAWIAVVLAAGQAQAQAPTQGKRQDRDAPALGLVVAPIDDNIKAAWRKDGLPQLSTRGLLVSKVLPGSPAARAGIRPVDVLVGQSNAKPLTSLSQFHHWVSDLQLGHEYRVKIRRPKANRQGRMIWKKLKVSIKPSTRAAVEEEALRCGYLRVDDRWVELPFSDFSAPSSQTRPFVPPKGRDYELPGRSTMWTSDPSRRPQGAKDITRRVVAQKRREWEERMPRIAVGEHGKILGFEVIQVLGPHDVIVQVGFEDLGYTLTGVPDRFEWLRLTGIDTTGLVDGRRAKLEEPIAIIGTWRYTTVLGARNTVFLAAPVPTLQRGLSYADLKDLKAWLD